MAPRSPQQVVAAVALRKDEVSGEGEGGRGAGVVFFAGTEGHHVVASPPCGRTVAWGADRGKPWVALLPSDQPSARPSERVGL